MSKRFRAWDVDQEWLLPHSFHDFVPPGHPAHLVRELVRSELNLEGDPGRPRRRAASRPTIRR
jgi:hypothetical protein